LRNSEELQGTLRNSEELQGTLRTPRNSKELRGTTRNSEGINENQRTYSKLKQGLLNMLNEFLGKGMADQPLPLYKRTRGAQLCLGA